VSTDRRALFKNFPKESRMAKQQKAKHRVVTAVGGIYVLSGLAAKQLSNLVKPVELLDNDKVTVSFGFRSAVVIQVLRDNVLLWPK
jgi:hypothetical protein